ncbi:MAG: hypothetical protein ACXWUD_09680 [Methylosarcina sp.]
MNVSRRIFLKGIALSGLASITLGRWDLSLANHKADIPPTRPILVLVSGKIEHSAFLQGIAATVRLGRTGLRISVPPLPRWARCGRAQRR